jgi:hypothetical protein
MSQQVEVRFKASVELSAKIKELQSIGEFDNAGGAVKSALAATIDNVIAAYKALGKGVAIAQTQLSESEPPKQQTPVQQTSTQTQQPTPPTGGFGNSFSTTKTKLAS